MADADRRSRSPRRFIPAPAGNARVAQSSSRQRRFIPAPAGNASVAISTVDAITRFIPAPAGNAVAEPRRQLLHTGGSSPRLRGTASSIRGSVGTPVHPRACGEHASQCGHWAPLESVHPRACGERDLDAALTTCVHRFIPAPAGNAPSGRRRSRSDRFIPAPAGNAWPSDALDMHRRRFIPAPAGNARSIARDSGLRQRFIPAPAGNAARPSPRRGGHVGSSPRLRGTRRSRVCCADFARFIPAPAGNAPPAVASERQGTRFIPAPAGNAASSTGTLDARFIPAPAGNARQTRRRSSQCIRFIPAPAGNAVYR